MHTGAMGKLLSLDARGRFGFSGGFGRLSFGYNRFAYYSWYAGIYQKKYLWGKPYISRSKFYRPKNNQMEKQQAWRQIFKDGKSAYDELTTEVKNQMRKDAERYHMTGYNMFMRTWLREHYPDIN